MTQPIRLSNPRRMRSARTFVLVGFLVGLSSLGAAQLSSPSGIVPGPCASPAMSTTNMLVCDGKGAPAGARRWLVNRKLDVNLATREDFMALPRVGPKTAAAIVATRTARGRFHSVADLRSVPGIGPKTLARVAPFLTVDDDDDDDDGPHN